MYCKQMLLRSQLSFICHWNVTLGVESRLFCIMQKMQWLFSYTQSSLAMQYSHTNSHAIGTRNSNEKGVKHSLHEAHFSLNWDWMNSVNERIGHDSATAALEDKIVFRLEQNMQCCATWNLAVKSIVTSKLSTAALIWVCAGCACTSFQISSGARSVISRRDILRSSCSGNCDVDVGQTQRSRNRSNAY